MCIYIYNAHVKDFRFCEIWVDGCPFSVAKRSFDTQTAWLKKQYTIQYRFKKSDWHRSPVTKCLKSSNTASFKLAYLRLWHTFFVSGESTASAHTGAEASDEMPPNLCVCAPLFMFDCQHDAMSKLNVWVLQHPSRVILEICSSKPHTLENWDGICKDELDLYRHMSHFFKVYCACPIHCDGKQPASVHQRRSIDCGH